jgi:hypothetical protein
MVIMLNPKNWISLPLLSAGIVLSLFIHTGHTAQLKDIRVGEYKDFTRIVFELDASAEPVKMELRSTTQMAVVFKKTSADLVRKIPVDRSPHVKDIQIWEKTNQLTVLLEFDFDSFDRKSFSLDDPPRLVLDIHPVPDVPNAGVEYAPGPTPDSERGSPHPVSTGVSEPASQPDEKTDFEKSGFQTPPPPGKVRKKPPMSVDQDQSPAAPPADTTRPSRLQFYLVIALVVITIVILVLLLLMLLARHRWIEDRSRLTAAENIEDARKT